jgi:hypothetical protein
MREEALLFGKTRSMVGIVTDPPDAKRGDNLPAIIILNAGITHRVGPNRLYVKIARNLASMGFVVFRFDHSGVGDSQARNDNLPFEKSSIIETQEAMNCMGTIRGKQRFVLIGLCSSTGTSFRTACCDQRVVGGVLLNALLEHRHNISDEIATYILDRKIVRSYWQIKLFDPKSWLKVIAGKANYWRIIKVTAFQLRSLFARKKNIFSGENKVAVDLRLLIERGVNLLFVYSEGTGVLEFFRVTLSDEIYKLSSSGKVRLEIIKHTDHTFTPLWSQEHLLKMVSDWAHAIAKY